MFKARFKSSATSKYLAERLLTPYQDHFTVCALRLFFLYGAHPTPKKTLINLLIDKIKHNQSIGLDGENGEGLLFTPTFTRDIARSIEYCLMNNLSGIFNIANPNAYSIKQVADTIAKNLNTQCSFERNRSKKALKIIPSIDKFLRYFPHMKFTPFEEGIRYCINKLHLT